MSQPAETAANYCYRHPDRQSWVLCQRCGRTICPECQTQAAVGVHCPECTREAQQSVPRTKPRWTAAVRRGSGTPVVTYSLMGVSVVVFLLMFVTGGTGGLVGQQVAYVPALTLDQPWRLITSMFAHASIFHLLFNMYALFLFGRELEVLLGRARFAALYLIAGLGGSAAVMVLAPASAVVGASGAIFGLFGAYFVITRHFGGNAVQLLIVIGLNFALAFVFPNISWQAHVGGAIFGALAALVLVNTRRRQQRPIQIAGLVGLGVVAILLLVSRFFVSY